MAKIPKGANPLDEGLLYGKLSISVSHLTRFVSQVTELFLHEKPRVGHLPQNL